MSNKVIKSKDTPQSVFVAQEALKAFENDPFYEALKKALIPLAVQMERSGVSPISEVLQAHAEKGVEHVNSIRKTFSTKAQKLQKTYTEIIAELNKGTKFGKQETVKKVQEQIDLNRLTEFQRAVHTVDIKAIRKLIKHENNEQKCKALKDSVYRGNTEIVEILLEDGNDVKVSSLLLLCHSAENGHAEIVKLLLEAGANAKAYDSYALGSSVENGHTATVKTLLDHGESLDDVYLTEKQRKNIEVRLKNLKLWREMYGAEPPKGLDGENPHGFKPELFETVKSWLIEEGHEEKDANKYAYGASTLFKNEAQILQYLEKWGEAGKQPLHNLTYMIKLPLTGKIDSKAWADATMKFGSEMAKLVSFADKLPQPAESLNKTREKCAEFNYERGSEHKALASLCMSHNVDEDDFEQALEIVLKNPNPTSNIPDIKISGDRFGMEGYSFEKTARWGY